MKDGLPKKRVVGVDISVGSFADQVAMMTAWGAAHRSAYVCCVNVHMCVEADKDPAFAQVVNGADLATPDGMPILKGLQWGHGVRQDRVAGNDLLPALLRSAEDQGLSVYFYGGEEAVLEKITARARQEHPRLNVAGSHAPPFRPLSAAEMDEVARSIAASGAHLVFVSLGCPKQERWMAAMKGRVPAVMVGVGGAFLLYAGVDSRAPKWMRDLSLEWLYRLALEPGRLWRRYLFTNTRFLYLVTRDLIRRPFKRREALSEVPVQHPTK